MITDLLTDEEILFFGRQLAKRGEGFIEMFDKYPTAHDTSRTSWTHWARPAAARSCRNILHGRLAPAEAAPPASSTGSMPATTAACATTGMAFTVRAPTFITFDDWSLWDGARAGTG